MSSFRSLVGKRSTDEPLTSPQRDQTAALTMNTRVFPAPVGARMIVTVLLFPLARSSRFFAIASHWNLCNVVTSKASEQARRMPHIVSQLDRMYLSVESEADSRCARKESADFTSTWIVGPGTGCSRGVSNTPNVVIT